ncbi:MAG: xylan 1,4-beta-xylosidase, partial [Ignavibacteriae bacterium]|nr:xylan 1,4-beta-xylosidase [Ignavibacteriota bacterium]
LTQRMFAYYSDTLASVGTTELNFKNMKDGDIAGLAVFQDPYAYIGIKKIKNKKYVIMVNNGKMIDSSEVKVDKIYLKANAIYGTGAADIFTGNAPAGTGSALFSYSVDNKNFTKIGDELKMRFSLKIFTGNKFCLFNYATKELGGYVDFNWFRTSAEKI